MKYIIFLLFLIIPFITNANTYIEKNIKWHTIKAISYDVWSDKYELEIAVSQNSISLREMLESNNAITWINWVFFCPKSYKECNWETFTINERYVKWEKIWKYDSTWDRVVFGWDKNENVFLFQTDKINKEKENDIYFGFANHPLLLEEWIPRTIDYWEKWLISPNMKTKQTRNFICNNKDNSNIFFWTVSNASIDELTEVLQLFWCYNALNLDAWWSLAYIYNSRYIAGPGREILDWVIIKRKWLDVKKIQKASKTIAMEILKTTKWKSNQEKIKEINNFIDKLSRYRNKIYSMNSYDILDENNEKIWYKLQMDDIESLFIINTINLSQSYLLEIRNILIKYIEVNSQNRLWIDFRVEY